MKPHSNSTKYFGWTLGLVGLAAVTLAVIFTFSTPQAKAKPHLLFKEPRPDGAVAKIGNREITEDEILGDSRLEYLDLMTRAYEIKMKGLEKMAAQVILGEQAKNAHVSYEEYIEQKIAPPSKIKVSDSEVTNFVEERHIPKEHFDKETKERIRHLLAEEKTNDAIEAALSRATEKDPIEVYFKRPEIKMPVSIGHGPAWGSDKVPVTIIEFGEFHCDLCGQWASAVETVKKRYKNKVRIFFRPFLSTNKTENEAAAEAVRCIENKGPDIYWKFIDILNNNNKKLTPKDLEKWAAKAGGDPKDMAQCLSSKKFSRELEVEVDDGHHAGARLDPTFFVNGYVVSGDSDPEDLYNLIEEQIGTPPSKTAQNEKNSKAN